jgi:hypothetical protein
MAFGARLSGQQQPIQRAGLDGFEDRLRGDPFGARPVSGRAGQLLLLESARLPFFSKEISCIGRADVLNIRGKPNRIYREPLCAVLIQLHLAGRLEPCNQPQEPL